MSKGPALVIAALTAAIGCTSMGHGGHGGGFGHSSSGGSSGGGHSWGGGSEHSSSSSSYRPSLASSSGSSSRSSSGSSSRPSRAHDDVGPVVRAVFHTLPTIAEALVAGAGTYDVDPPRDEPDPSVPIVDPCQACPLEDPCGTCAGYADYACRDTIAGVLSRCESTAPPTARPAR